MTSTLTKGNQRPAELPGTGSWEWSRRKPGEWDDRTRLVRDVGEDTPGARSTAADHPNKVKKTKQEIQQAYQKEVHHTETYWS